MRRLMNACMGEVLLLIVLGFVPSVAGKEALKKTLEELLDINAGEMRDVLIADPPLYMKDIFDSLGDDSDEMSAAFDNFANPIIRAFKPIHVEEDSKAVLLFNISDVLRWPSPLVAAELALVRNAHILSHPPHEYVLRISSTMDIGERFKRIYEEPLSPIASFEHHFDVVDCTATIRGWLDVAGGGVGRLAVHLRHGAENQEAAFVRDAFNFDGEAAQQPVLVVYAGIDPVRVRHAANGRRQRRQAEEQTATGGVKRKRVSRRRPQPAVVSQTNRSDLCGLHSFYVDFRAIGMRNVLQPEGVYVNYCAGACPYPIYDSFWNATGNAIARSAYRQLSDDEAASESGGGIPDAMCAPTALRSHLVIFQQGTDFVTRPLPNITAVHCGCH